MNEKPFPRILLVLASNFDELLWYSHITLPFDQPLWLYDVIAEEVLPKSSTVFIGSDIALFLVVQC